MNVVIMYTTVFINQFIVHFFISLASHFAGPSCEFPLWISIPDGEIVPPGKSRAALGEEGRFFCMQRLVTKNTARLQKLDINGKSSRVCLQTDGCNPKAPWFLNAYHHFPLNHWHTSRRPASFAAAGVIAQSRGFGRFSWWQLWVVWMGGRDQYICVREIRPK